MDLVARALAAPRRREILALVRDGELSAGEIASRFDVSRPAISQHLAALREAGLLSGAMGRAASTGPSRRRWRAYATS